MNKDEILVEIGSRIRKLREARGEDQRSAAAAIKERYEVSLDGTYLSMIESGYRVMPFWTIFAVADYFCCDAGTLILGLKIRPEKK